MDSLCIPSNKSNNCHNGGLVNNYSVGYVSNEIERETVTTADCCFLVEF